MLLEVIVPCFPLPLTVVGRSYTAVLGLQLDQNDKSYWNWKSLLVTVPVRAPWVLRSYLTPLHTTSQHDGFLNLAQDVQCKAAEMSKEPQTQALYIFSLDIELNLLQPNLSLHLRAQQDFKLDQDLKTPAASTLAGLHFVQHIPSREALGLYF